MAQLFAVVERRVTPDGQGAPWPTTPLPADRFIRLSGATIEQEVGAVAWQLILYNHLSADEPLRAASTAKNLVLPGGLAVEGDESLLIAPSCCAGLETWREWSSVPQEGGSPWMGHDPSPWIEDKGDILRVWADGGLTAVRQDDSHVDFLRSELAFQLRRVEGDLQAFLARLESWAQARDATSASAFTTRFDQMFEITRKATRPRVT
jgi:hypothetical protein